MMFIPELLSKAAIEQPDKEAFRCKGQGLTYMEAEAAVDAAVGLLVSKGINKGDRVGIFSSKCLDEIIALFAIMRIGAVFVHINPFFKEEQLRHIAADCGIKLLFLHEGKTGTFLKAELAGTVPDVISLPLAEYKPVDKLEKIEPNPASEDDPAAILYTSGSTGRPKGIVVTHRILYESTVVSAGLLGNHAGDRIISVTPFSFDGALSQLFTSVFAGATLILQDSVFPKDIVSTLLTERITGFHAVPSFWRMLLQRHSPFAGHHYPNLRYISIIGEAFPHDEIKKLRSVLPETLFYMMYGTTEAFRSTCLLPEDFERKFPSAGKPLPGVEIGIVNPEGEPCRPGEIGEITHRGAFVSPGYWNLPKLTAETFRNGMLYTGDLGWLDEEGFLYIEGRKDMMLKLMGIRVSPEEIEDGLNRMPGIKEAAVVGITDVNGNVRIKAVIVREEGASLEVQDVILHCKRNLPHYMIPYEVEFCGSLPKTATLKINRSLLKEPAGGMSL
ncbi:AMP-binding protein [Paenibacillus zanthoxyli]|uniref:AMP-binding protein n=1 Tax=Paenibacillus zanthoxyli TaxID=369399 RepID=UPI0004BB17B4|nr:AMP-binding protein [Paenibacillus zanthoxyli]